MTGQRLVAVFFLGVLLLNYPLLALFGSAEPVAGIPLLFLYVFVGWAGIIALLALAIERTRDKREQR